MIFPNLKAPITKIFMLTMNQMTVCNVKWVAHGDIATDNCDPTLHCPSAVQSILASFSLLFLFTAVVHLSLLSSMLFPMADSCFHLKKNSEVLTVHFSPTIKLVGSVA